jgi:hypothetical protein
MRAAVAAHVSRDEDARTFLLGWAPGACWWGQGWGGAPHSLRGAPVARRPVRSCRFNPCRFMTNTQTRSPPHPTPPHPTLPHPQPIPARGGRSARARRPRAARRRDERGALRPRVAPPRRGGDPRAGGGAVHALRRGRVRPGASGRVRRRAARGRPAAGARRRRRRAGLAGRRPQGRGRRGGAAGGCGLDLAGSMGPFQAPRSQGSSRLGGAHCQARWALA